MLTVRPEGVYNPRETAMLRGEEASDVVRPHCRPAADAASRPAGQRDAAVELLLNAGRFTLTVRGSCMAPGIPAGARVRIEPCAPAGLSCGDVVLLRRGGRLRLHRYLGRCSRNGRPHLVCKADARRRPDAPWPVGALAGRAASAEGLPDARLRASGAGHRMYLRLYSLAARLALACGLRPAPDEEDRGPLRVRCLGRMWQMELRPDSAGLREALAQGLRLAESSPAAADAAVCIGTDGPAAGIPPGVRRSAEGIECATPLFAVRLSADGLRGEVSAARAGDALAGIEALFRLAAMHAAATGGGVALHAASALSPGGGLYVFAGPAGAGKTTAAEAFGGARVLDEDLVLVLPDGNAFQRVPHQPLARSAAAAGEAFRPHPVRAVLLPEPGEAFAIERLRGPDALVRCLHVPPALTDAEAAADLLAAAHRLVEGIPVCRMRWRKGEPLPALLAEAFETAPRGG